MSKFFEVLFITIATLCMVATFTLIVAEWAAGCGETYVDAYGKRHAYECMFLPTPVLREEARNR